jgi:hypothetical protein
VRREEGCLGVDGERWIDRLYGREMADVGKCSVSEIPFAWFEVI